MYQVTWPEFEAQGGTFTEFCEAVLNSFETEEELLGFIGSSAEVQFWVDNDLTLEQVIELHTNLWGLSKTPSFEHEISHVLLGLAILANPKLRHLPFQGTHEAEIYVFELQKTLASRRGMESFKEWTNIFKKDRFLNATTNLRQSKLNIENQLRIVRFLLSEELGLPVQKVWHDASYSSFKLGQLARENGIKINILDEEISVSKDSIPILEQFLYASRKVIEFKSPTSEQSTEVFQTILPVINSIEKNLKRLAEIALHSGTRVSNDACQLYRPIRVKHLFELMQEGVLERQTKTEPSESSRSAPKSAIPVPA